MKRPASQEVSETALARARQLATGLYPHQVEGVAFLLARRRSILADDMGLGKTRQSIVAMREAAPNGPWIVVCPASVKQNWRREIRMVDKDADVIVVDSKTIIPTGHTGWIVINYDILKRCAEVLKVTHAAGFVFDEAHYLKNHQSQRSKAARALLDEANDAVVHCLTGTPMMNRPRDLFPLLQLVDHSLGKSFLGFAKRYCDAHKGDYGWVTKGASNLEELGSQLQGTMLRRTKDEVLDLPPKLRTWLSVDIPSTTRRGMRRVIATLLKETSDHAETDEEKSQRLPPISRAKLIARLSPIRSSTAGAKMSYTTEFAKGILEQGEKVVIYSCFQEVIEAFIDDFKDYGVRFLTGGSSSDSRQSAVDDFQNRDDVRVFLSTVIAGGVGITLTAARHVIFNDLDWVPANHWQAEDRAYRIGQSQTVNIYYLKAAGSIDEFVGQILEAKSNMINTVVEAPNRQSDAHTGDVLTELQVALTTLDIASHSDATDERFDTVIEGALRRYVESNSDAQASAHDPLHSVPKANAATITALARSLSPKSRSLRFRTPSSKADQFYELDVEGTDVTCSCRGFEFRGQCKHARKLKAALAAGEDAPAEYQQQS